MLYKVLNTNELSFHIVTNFPRQVHAKNDPQSTETHMRCIITLTSLSDQTLPSFTHTVLSVINALPMLMTFQHLNL